MQQAIRHKAMDLLARREHSYAELRRKLLAKNFDEDKVETVLAQLQQESLLSDERFAEQYCRHRKEAGYGPLRIRQELQQKGVAGDLVESVLSAVEEDWSQRLQEVWQRKYGATPSREPKEKARQLRFLMQRGFSTEAIYNLFNE